MAQLDDPTAPVTPEGVMAYLKGVPAQSSQFDFLLGQWHATTTRYRPDGGVIASYPGTWRAQHLHEGRMVLDEFIARADEQTEIAYMATLRTYSAATGRWEMTFLIAHEPQQITRFTGAWIDGEMQLEGSGRTRGDQPVLAKVRFFDIANAGFEWENHVSLDGGASWYRDSAISARRV